jgi:hypothetical protein
VGTETTCMVRAAHPTFRDLWFFAYRINFAIWH